jgi:DNA-binding response OmpR family regulator
MATEDRARILIVDDDDEIRILLTRLIQSLGYQALEAANGPDALKQAEEQGPDAVVLDINMPAMDGLEVCRRLRTLATTRLVPILLVTANDDLETRVASFEAGADDFVSKPFQGPELAARLQAHLQLTRARSELSQLQGVLATIRLISHEFNNPLQTVLGGLDLFRIAREGGPVEEEEALAMVASGAEKVAELSKRLVQISEPAFKPSPIGPMLDMEESR